MDYSEIWKFITTQDWLAVVGSITVLLGIAYKIALIIPGDQPEKFIKWLLDLTSKISRK